MFQPGASPHETTLQQLGYYTDLTFCTIHTFYFGRYNTWLLPHQLVGTRYPQRWSGLSLHELTLVRLIAQTWTYICIMFIRITLVTRNIGTWKPPSTDDSVKFKYRSNNSSLTEIHILRLFRAFNTPLFLITVTRVTKLGSTL